VTAVSNLSTWVNVRVPRSTLGRQSAVARAKRVTVGSSMGGARFCPWPIGNPFEAIPVVGTMSLIPKQLRSRGPCGIHDPIGQSDSIIQPVKLVRDSSRDELLNLLRMGKWLIRTA